MKTNKKRIIIITVSIISILTISAIGFYWYTHPTHYLYEDRWIIGKTPEQIEQRYGDFDYFDITTPPLIRGYSVKTDQPWGDTNWPEYYMIYFDENDKAYKVQVVEGGWGG